MNIKVKFISTTNDYIGEGQLNKIGILSIDKGYIDFFNRNGVLFKSSPLESVKKDTNTLTFETINSTYVFEIVQDFKFELSLKKDTNTILIIKYFSSLGSKSFHCTTKGSETGIETSTVVFDTRYTHKEAQSIIKNTNIYAQNNQSIVRILLPVNERKNILDTLSFDSDENIIVSDIACIPLKAIMGQEKISVKHFFKKLVKIGIPISEQ